MSCKSRGEVIPSLSDSLKCTCDAAECDQRYTSPLAADNIFKRANWSVGGLYISKHLSLAQEERIITGMKVFHFEPGEITILIGDCASSGWALRLCNSSLSEEVKNTSMDSSSESLSKTDFNKKDFVNSSCFAC